MKSKFMAYIGGYFCMFTSFLTTIIQFFFFSHFAIHFSESFVNVEPGLQLIKKQRTL